MSLHTCGADPRGVRVEWGDGGGRTHLVAVTELGRMLGNDPNSARSVLHGLGRWEVGKSGGGGHGPTAHALAQSGVGGRGHQEQEAEQQQQQQQQQRGEDTPRQNAKPPSQGPQETQEAPPLRE